MIEAKADRPAKVEVENGFAVERCYGFKSNAQATIEELIPVPLIPTSEMIDAAWASATAEDAKGVWADMIAAWLKNRELAKR
jgi:hypothetical protein